MAIQFQTDHTSEIAEAYAIWQASHHRYNCWVWRRRVLILMGATITCSALAAMGWMMMAPL